MPFSLTCKGCKSTLKAPDELAGKKVKCPKCKTLVKVPLEQDEDDDEPVEVMPDERVRQAPPRKAAPARSRRDDDDEDEEEDDRPARRSTRVRQEDDDDRRRRRPRDRDADDLDDGEEDTGPRYKPCPNCGKRGAKRVLWTVWGSFYGPAMFTHVRCPKCRTAYNGKTGRSNLIPAVVLFTLPLLGILAIIGGMVYLLYSRGYFG